MGRKWVIGLGESAAAGANIRSGLFLGPFSIFGAIMNGRSRLSYC